MFSLFQDLRYGFRRLRKTPGFTLIASLTLAIGVGSAVSIFSVLNALVFDPFPYPNSDRIAYLWSSEGRPFSMPDYEDVRDQNQSFEEIGVHRPDRFNLGGESPESVLGAYCTAGVLRVLDMQPVLGRWLEEADEKPGAPPVAVISHSLWMRKFASDTQIVGKSIRLNGNPITVVGVMPPRFEFPSPWGGECDLWTPLDPSQRRSRGSHWLLCIGRLKPGVALQTADAEIKTIGVQLAKEYPDTNRKTPFVVHSLFKEMTQGGASELLILSGAVVMVLLVSCANVASMLLAMNAHRQTEFGVRIALGASRGRILHLLLSECLLLGFLGCGLGVLFAFWGVDAIRQLIPAALARREAMRIDAPVLAFSVVLTFLTVLLFGLPPAFTAARASLLETLKQTGKSQTGSRIRHRFLKGLIVIQIALALMLANGAALLSASYLNVLKTNKSLDTEFVLSSEIVLDQARYPTDEARNRFWNQLVGRARILPGVQSAAVTSKLPLEGGRNNTYLLDDWAYETGVERPWAEYSYISSNYFTVMDIPLLRGRLLSEEDGAGEVIHVVVNRAFVEKYWPNQDPLGRRIRPNDPQAKYTAMVVGVVEDMRQWGAERPPVPEIYYHCSQNGASCLSLVVRTMTEAAGFVPLLRRELAALDSDLPLANIRTMKEVVGASMHSRRFVTQLIDTFMAIALILCAVGVYGTLSYQLLQRTREIGLRMALGAGPRQIAAFVFRQAGVWTIVGLILGFVGTVVLSYFIRSLFFGVSSLNPYALALGLGLSGGAAGLACLIPAWRAVRLHPVEALRCE